MVKVVQAMYVCARRRTRVNSQSWRAPGISIKSSAVNHSRGSTLMGISCRMSMEALSREVRVGCPWEMLYADDLVILDETFEGLMTKMAEWKNGLESKGLKVNMGKTKVMISNRDLHTSQTSDKYPCAVYRKVSGTTQSSVANVHFGLTKGVLISHVD